jgi:hypothetical protein
MVMPMVVRFTKARHEERPHTFTCIRSDGTTTGMASTPFFVRHDLTHFAVETVLGLTDAFYGLIAAGWDIDSFADREGDSRKVRKLPSEAIVAEIIVGSLDLDWAAGPLATEQTVAIISEKFVADDIECQPPTAEQIDNIRLSRADLLARWQTTMPGQSLDLSFPD